MKATPNRSKESKKQQRKYSLERKHRLLATGFCPQCGKQSDRPGRNCTGCQEKVRAYMFKRYRTEHDIPLNWPKCIPGRPKIEAWKGA